MISGGFMKAKDIFICALWMNGILEFIILIDR